MKTLKTNYSISTCIKRIIFIIPLLLISMTLSAQDTSDYEKAKSEIKETFGTFPSWFDSYPKYALSTAWENYKTLKSSNSTISSKNTELIQLAVAAQIPCVYCVYFHRISAKEFGATDEEIKEAVALGAETRHWSMVIQGSGISFEEFKAEFDEIMKYMSEKSKN
jgi:AhpD family alkylhydroperoxidase